MAATTARKVEGYAKISEKVLQEESIIRAVSRTDVEGGAVTAKIYVHELMTLATYVPGTGVAQTTDTSAYVSLNNLVEDAVNELLDGVTVEMAPDDTVGNRIESATSAFALDIDLKGFIKMVADGTEVVAAGGPKPVVGTIYKAILALKLALDTAKAPKKDRSLIITAEMENLLIDVDSKIVLNTDRGDKILTDGFIGAIAGFNVFGTVHLPAGTNMIAVQKRGFAHIDEWTRPPAIVSLDGSEKFYGDSAVKGRLAFNSGAIRPTLIQIDNGAA
jgi:acylphosphatase